MDFYFTFNRDIFCAISLNNYYVINYQLLIDSTYRYIYIYIYIYI